MIKIAPIGQFEPRVVDRFYKEFHVDHAAPDIVLLERPDQHIAYLGKCSFIACPCTSDHYFTGPCITLKGDPVLQQITPTAEHVFGLLWAVQRNGAKAVNWRSWNREHYIADKGWAGQLFKIVGWGRLGGMVANRAFAFNMLSTESQAEDADIVFLHADRNPTSERMVNSEWLSQCKDGAYLINTAFGEMVDDEAIIDALETGKLAGYAADVLSGEYEPGFNAWNHPIVKAREHLNIVLTPHIGGSTHDAREATQMRILDKIKEHFDSSSNPRP